MTTRPTAKQKSQNNRDSFISQGTYVFKDEQANMFFHLLNKKGKRKLLENQKPEETKKTGDCKYCL